MKRSADVVVIGAGIVGLTVARELKHRYKDVTVKVLEKEPVLGVHSSGRNSGVLHSGIYYKPETLKARACTQGRLELTEYCRDRNLPLRQCGKVLVAVNEDDAAQLDMLAERALINGIDVEIVDETGLGKLEPETRSASGKALYIPGTSVGSPKAVLDSVKDDVVSAGVGILFSATIDRVDMKNRRIRLSNGDTLHYGTVVNAAGLHADTVAHQFGVGQRYTLLPFKGIYWKLDPASGINVNHLVYPVPDLRVPFLGVHTTTTTDGNTYLGPTAVPALGREQYQGLQGLEHKEVLRISSLLASQFILNHEGFRRLAWQEGRRYFKSRFASGARAILPRLKSEHLLRTDKVGIRAQMLDRITGRLVTDFLVEQGADSIHILNAISPAWTSAFPFARYICDNFIK